MVYQNIFINHLDKNLSTSLYLQTYGNGSKNIVLLHGWGLNSNIWKHLVSKLNKSYQLHFIDLPGYGFNKDVYEVTLNGISKKVISCLPSNSVLIGWSLGGLIATQIAFTVPNKINGLITVASSPCFIAKNNWPGIGINLLKAFKEKLKYDFYQTIERFLLLQTLGTQNNYFNTYEIRKILFFQHKPSIEILNHGLDILSNMDIRGMVSSIKLPFLRIYGALDSLVPRQVVPKVDRLIPLSSSVIIEQAAHVPFISHVDNFCYHITNFLSRINYQ
ncbi:MAG: pimeloyl-ACP methyl ester esterase BioH [Pantoea sp. Brub]|nr:pimeloyl-ACP methyl ester esterase BioH [Pantoea sp. Brub]